MEKYCPKCKRVFEDLKYEVCPVCTITLMEREGRIRPPKGVREEVFRRDGYTCQMCGASKDDGAKLELDHIIPVAQGGTNDISNLQTLCRECNQNKSDLILPSGLKIDIEIKQNKLNTLNRLLQENKNKLDNTTNENDRIKYSFNIKQLEEQIPPVIKELNELKIKYNKEQEKIRIEKEKQEKQELLFKKLYVDLSPIEKLVLKENFGLNNLSDEDMLKTLCSQYSEKEIVGAIENYKTDLHQYLNDTIRFNMLHLISSKLSLNNSSKQFIINYLYNNYTKMQIKDLLGSIDDKLFNKYDSSFNNIEKSLLKRHYSLNEASDDELINYIIENDFSIDEINNTVELSYKNVFKDFYNKLNDNQKDLVKYRFKNSKKNFVNFLAKNNFSFKELTDELNKTKLELFNKKFNSLNEDKQSLMERYSKVYSHDFDLLDYFYKNKFSDEKIDKLVEMSKKPLITEVHNNLNNHQMFLLENTFENNNALVEFMVEHHYSFKSLRKKLNKTENAMADDLNNSLNNKHKFLLRKYFSIINDSYLIKYLIDHKYNVNKSLKIANNYKKELYDEFDNFINNLYAQIICTKLSLNFKSKTELIDYLIFEDYTVETIKSLIKNEVYDKYSSILDANSISLLCYKFKLVTATKISPITIKEYLFENDYALFTIQQSIKEAKKELYDELDKKIDYRAVGLLNKELKFNKSKEDLISHLIENYTVESIRKLVKKYHINI